MSTGPLLLYGVVRAPGRSGGADLDDLATGAVAVVVHEAVAAVVASTVPGPGRARRADLMAYHAVLDALAQRGPVAPVRFGTVLPDRAAVVDLLAQHGGWLAATLDRLTGCHQFNLRATYVEGAVLAEIVAERPEVRALRERTRALPELASYRDRIRLGELVGHELERRSAQDARQLLAAVTTGVTDYHVRSAPAGTQVLDLALLVDDARATDVLDRLEDVAQRNHERLRMRLVGPLPAHDFTGEPAWA